MKTPKRITYCSCGCAMNLESGDYMDDKGKFHNATALFCPRCGAAYPGEAFAARCIRKNREARLRHALRKKDNAISLLAEKLLRVSMQSQAYNSFIDKMLDSYFESGTCNQDIEGS